MPEASNDALSLPHRKFPAATLWRVLPEGVVLEGQDRPLRTRGRPATVTRIWRQFGRSLEHAADAFEVPSALLLATVATETRGQPGAVRHEPGYAVRLVEDLPPGAGVGWLNAHYKELPVEAFRRADDVTPYRVSPGLTQTLLSTAREALGEPRLSRADLLEPEIALYAAAAYIRDQADRPTDRSTFLDPVLVAAAYNAGGLYQEAKRANPWRLRCYPLGTGEHISRFVRWYGDACAVIDR